MLTVIAGSVVPWVISLVDDQGLKENLAGITKATLVVKDSLNGNQILLFRTADANLSIDSSEGTLTVMISQVQADSLQTQVGILVGQASLEFPSGWFDTKYFDIKVLQGIAPHTP